MKTILRLLAILFCVASVGVKAADSDCVSDGGKTQCTKPLFGAWDFSYCRAGDYVLVWHSWCTARGGTWDSSIPGCIGGVTVTDDNFDGLASRAESIFTGCGMGTARQGWGITVDTICKTGSAGYINDQPVLEYDIAIVGPTAANSPCGSAQYTLQRQKPVTCPQGYELVTIPGKAWCIKAQPCETCVGNPVDVGNGEKRQREPDYQSPAAGGLEFARYYNSAGTFSPNAESSPSNDDFWRHTYSSRIVEMPGVTTILAAAQRYDGTVKYFNLDGSDLHNQPGGQYRLAKLTSGGVTTGWQITTPASDVEAYDAQGRLTTITTRSGFVTSLAYDANGRLQTVTDTFGRTITLGYDANGRLSTMTDPSSRNYQYAYDAQGRLSTVTYPNSTTRTYVYENAAWPFALTGIIDERGARFSTYGYDSTGRATLTEHAGYDNHFSLSFSKPYGTPTSDVIDAFNSAHTYTFTDIGGMRRLTQHAFTGRGTETRTYDAAGNLATLTDWRGIKTSYAYDLTRNLETSRTEADGTYWGATTPRTTATTWHPTYRLPATITRPSGLTGVNEVTTFTYDANGNLTKKNITASALVREWNYAVNARGQVLGIDGPRTDTTDVTTLTYYADNDVCTGCRGQVYTTTNAAGHVTTFNTYDADGRPTQITDANGVATTLAYHPRGWLASRSVAGETTAYDYDLVGNLAKVTLPDGSWVHYVYDAANGLVAVDDTFGNVIDYELDVMGNRVRESVYDPQNQLKKTMQRVYDGVNRLQREIGAAGQTTQYAYDNNGNPTQVTDPLYRVTSNSFADAFNRLLQITDPANGSTVFTYDLRDRLKSVKDPKLSTTTSYTYDALGNLATQVSPDTGTTTFTYDAAGNVASQTDARNVAITYTYDALNRVTAATVTDGTVSYEYDNTTTGGAYAKGRLTKVTDPSGFTTYAYDALGRVTSKAQTVNATPASRAFTLAYAYANGRQTGITYPSGRALTYGFDSQGHVASISVDGTTVILAGAEYFPFGGVKKWSWGNAQVYERGFDLDGRVSTVTLGPGAATYADLSQVFGYDSLNRLTSANLAAGQNQGFAYDANGNRTSATVNAATTTYTYPTTSHKLSSLSGATTRSFTYDNAGNVTASAGITYVYDGRGRMKQAGATTYLVNGLGQRVKKSTAGVDTYFAYDEAGHLIGEYDTTGAPIEETVWLGDLPVAVIKPNGTGFDAFYIWADQLGTPRQITDAANQSRWEWPNNDPFGNNLPNENPAGLGAFAYNLRFPGQYYDSETGKHYNYFRDYDPIVGRYAQSDPIGLVGGLNTYAFVESGPLNGIDPRGLATYICTKPLHALGDYGPRVYNPTWYNPLYHQFACVRDASGAVTCGGQDRSGSGIFPGSPGKPSDDHWPAPGEGQCKLQDSRNCVDECVKRKIKSKNRPKYAIGPHGTDCQEWSDDVVESCRAECKGKQ